MVKNSENSYDTIFCGSFKNIFLNFSDKLLCCFLYFTIIIFYHVVEEKIVNACDWRFFVYSMYCFLPGILLARAALCSIDVGSIETPRNSLRARARFGPRAKSVRLLVQFHGTPRASLLKRKTETTRGIWSLLPFLRKRQRANAGGTHRCYPGCFLLKLRLKRTRSGGSSDVHVFF